MISCELCGQEFNVGETTLCKSCPLHTGCDLTCCPNCGYSSIASNGRKKPWGWKAFLGEKLRDEKERSNQMLGNFPAGMETIVQEFSGEMPESNRLFLLGRGIRPGKSIKVLQSSPAVVIQVDHLQVALEKELAELIFVN